MPSKHMKKCSTSLAIKELQIKMTLRFYLTPVKVAIINNTNNKKCLWGCEGKGTHIHCWCECKLCHRYGKQYGGPSKNQKIELPYDSVIPLLVIYPEECAPWYDRAPCTLMLIAALFTIAKLWKQPRCPVTDEWIKKMWYV
jgi:hypothetical protein